MDSLEFMDQNNAVRTIEDVSVKLKGIQSQRHLYQKELERMLAAKAKGSHMAIRGWKKDIKMVIATLEKAEELKMALVRDMAKFVAMKYKIELAEQKAKDSWRRYPLLRRSGKEDGAI